MSAGNGHTYTMSVDLSVLDALGINLYSNAAAVLSELVANAYDADATRVTISWKENGEQIIVSDDGVGMTADELNERFLKVGYKKRESEGLRSEKWGRPFMGRKGIGKLSVFSIARTITLYSAKNGESHGLRIVVGDLENAIQAGVPYHPEAIDDVPTEYAGQGTTLCLDDLKTKRADLTANALRKRLARRFDVLDQTPREQGGFYIEVNGKPITYADRQELKKLEFIWEFGAETLPSEALPDDATRFVVSNPPLKPGTDWVVRGWFGTAKVPTDLTNDREAGSLKNIIVLARKRPIQEGIVEKLDFSRIFGNYVTGQIEADFLDLDGEWEDIATSDRQRLIEDDERVLALQAFLREAFKKAADEWSENRPKKEAKDALAKYPKIREWVETRPPWQRPAAEKMIGTVASLELEDKNGPKDKADLFRAGVLAFERVGLRQASDDLEQLSSVTADSLLPLLGAQDAYEAGLWVDILRSRVEAIAQFRRITNDDQKEVVLQEHLFKHLWLLDAAWERAATGGRMEENLKEIAPGLFAKDPEDNTIEGRIDIRYAKASGQHVIVELKRYSARPTAAQLQEQGLKYYTALTSILEQQQRTDNDIAVVFVLGTPPRVPNPGRQSEEEFISGLFESINGRYVLYDALIENAKHQYEDYLNASDQAKQLDELLGTWGTELATDGAEASNTSPAVAATDPLTVAAPEGDAKGEPSGAAKPAGDPVT
jgi:hypothetical protein